MPFNKKDDWDKATRITIDPMFLLKSPEFRTFIIAQRRTPKDANSIQTTADLFISTNWHLNWPTLLSE
jgi:hypothetical protein